MGCVFGKASYVVKDKEESPKQRELRRKASELRAARSVSSNRKEYFPHGDKLEKKLEKGDVKIALVDKKSNVSGRVRENCYGKKTEIVSVVGRFPKALLEGELVAAGWPNWLVNVAGEAIQGWVPRKANTFEKLDKIGQGTYSSVYKARDILNNKDVALKKVRFDNMDPESVKFMAREILILRRLDHQNVIKLEALVTSRTSSSLYLVFEYMEHDLTGLGALPEVKFTEPQVKCYMKQLLSGLDHCHKRGVLHRDIKGSNLLIDNHGTLKIADFGLASSFDNQNVPLTSRVVTLWYRPPELLLGETNYGIAVDLWSTGCILGELYTGKPIMPGRTEVEQLHKIFKLCGSPSEEYWMKTKLPHATVFKPNKPYRKRIAETLRDVPEAAVELMETLLSVDPAYRGTADSALKSEFFRTEPLPCDPSSLPKYPPSKEIDAKLREEESRRHRVSGVKGQKVESDLKGSKELRAAAAPHANAELAMSMQRRQGQSNPKSRSEYFSSQNGEPCSDFLVNPPSSSQGLNETSKDRRQIIPERIIMHSGPLKGRKTDDASNFSTKNDLSQYSGLVTSKALPSSQGKIVPSQVQAANQFSMLSESFGDPMRNRDGRHHSQVFHASQQLENGRATRTKEHTMDGHVNREKKIHFSGPLVAPSTNIEQILREHDRRIQEVGRRQRRDKAIGRPQEQNPTQRVG